MTKITALFFPTASALLVTLCLLKKFLYQHGVTVLMEEAVIGTRTVLTKPILIVRVMTMIMPLHLLKSFVNFMIKATETFHYKDRGGLMLSGNAFKLHWFH
jgi:hypothetical protein